MTDVAVVFESLLESGYGQTLSKIQKAPLCKAQVDRLCVIAFLHDLGKAHTDFQIMAFPERKHEIRVRGHVMPACSLLDQKGDIQTTQALEEHLGIAQMLPWVGGCPGELARLFLSSWGHHGEAARFHLDYGCTSGDVSKVRWDGIQGWEAEKLFSQLKDEIDEHWPNAFGEAPPFYLTGAFLQEFNGLVTLADWMGSDIRFFPHDTPDGMSRYEFAKASISSMLVAVGRKAQLKETSFTEVFGFPPNSIQSALI